MNFRTCACGCGKQFGAIGRRKFRTRACQQRAYRRRVQARVTIREGNSSSEPAWTRNSGGSGAVYVEIVGVHTDYPGYRVAELLDLQGESLRIHYPGSGGERIITRNQVHGVIVLGEPFREEAQHLLDTLTWEAA